MKIRMKDMAKQLNVSQSTVSRALSDNPLISNETKEKVISLAKKLHYYPNLIAKSLKTNTTKTIGLIIADITNPYYPDVVKGVEDYSNNNDFNIILCNSDYDPEKEYQYLKVLVGKGVDGIIISSVGNNARKFLNELKIPFVLIDTVPSQRSRINSICSDHAYGSYLATKHLIELGHTKIALVNGPKTVIPCKQLEDGFKKAMHQYNININNNYLIECDMRTNSGYKATKELLKMRKDELPTAIIFISDKITIEAYHAIYETGFKIPDHFSIIGNDDISVAKNVSPPLTTISQPKYKVGWEAMKLLISLLNHKIKDEYKQIILLPELTIRKSTGITMHS